MTDFELPRPDFHGVRIEQTGSRWLVTWELAFTCHNVTQALGLAGTLVGIEAAAHGDWEARVTLTQDSPRGEEANG